MEAHTAVLGPWVLVFLLISIIWIIVSTSKWKIHPFLSLLVAAYGMALGTQWVAMGYGIPAPFKDSIGKVIADGFGGILGYIGLVIIAGTIIGVILEKSGAVLKMAEVVLKVVGPKRPMLAMSIIGYIVSIPVFCDSGYVILSSLKRALARKAAVPLAGMAVALSTGLYATHTLVPPTPGPIAAAANLGLEGALFQVIVAGLVVAIPAAAAGYLWAKRVAVKLPTAFDRDSGDGIDAAELAPAALPSAWKAFLPIVGPIVLIALGSIAQFPSQPFGEGILKDVLVFLGTPVNALFVGLACALLLLPRWDGETLTDWVGKGLVDAASILMITGAGGAFGAVLKATTVGDYIGAVLRDAHLGLFLPFLMAAALKTAQGSSTVALVTTSAIVAPMLESLGLASGWGPVLTVMAIGAGAMTVSHVNDSYFWVVSQFSGMSVTTAYRAQTAATLVQGLVAMATVWMLFLVLL
ncbi:GntP family permease [Calditerricola satsumensis]|uniref:Permease n=1 Tax=Calditerricola satsumensis TaxID=373054 RepID=A0A8J3BC93_9BACI|nr:GntP family permease [Calditerricola satsumensis]GGK04588.1 permease [Calditerricola satsumensis]